MPTGILEVAGPLLVVAAALSVWVFRLKRQIHVRQSSEAALRESKERLDLALSAADVGTWRRDAIGYNTRDATLNRMLGLDPVESRQTERDYLERIHPDDYAANRAEFDRAIRDRDTYSSEYRIIRADGSIRWLRAQGRPFATASGAVESVMGATIDITDRREAEAALRASEEKFAKAFRASPDCIVISDYGPGGIVEVNDQFERLTGYSRAEALGRTLVELGFVEGANGNTWMERLGKDRVLHDHKLQIRRKNGDLGTIVMSAELIEIGGHERFLSVSRDVTDRTRAEDALQRTEAKYRELVENANDIVFTVDRDGYCLSMNRAGQTISGYVADAPGATHVAQLVVPEQADFVRRQFQSVLDGDDVPAMEIDIINTAGARITLEVAVRPIAEGGSIVAAQAIARDVTARRELEQQRRQAQKMDAVGKLAAGVAHDFNNLLTIILGNCEVAEPLLDDHDQLQHMIKDIREAGERAASLTGQLLAFSRRQVIQPRVLDLNEVVVEIRRMLTRLIGEDIDVRFNPGEGLWHVYGDLGQLQQVIVNVAVNARDAMPHGGRLTIETRNIHHDRPYVDNTAKVPAGDYVLLSATDTGVGMDDATRERLFEPFFTTKDPGKGTGLGLAMVYGIVKQSGGFVFADSRPGEGTTFRMLLPRAHEALKAANEQPLRIQAATGHEIVLLVEDEDHVRELLCEYLAAQGYDVLSAATGDAGIELCRTRDVTPAVLVTDIVMPGMNGRALAEQMRTAYPDLKVLYMSGYTDTLVRHGPLPSGTHFLQKPFVLATLAKKIREMVDSAGS